MNSKLQTSGLFLNVEVCADFGADDEAFKGALGSCNYLDNAIYYYLDLDEDPYEEEYEWDE